MSDFTWHKGFSDATAGVHRSGQDIDYECGWRHAQLTVSLDEQLIKDYLEVGVVPPGCIEVVDERSADDQRETEASGSGKSDVDTVFGLQEEGPISGRAGGPGTSSDLRMLWKGSR